MNAHPQTGIERRRVLFGPWAVAALLVLSVVDIAQAQIVRAFTPRFSRSDRGNFLAIGNTLMTCPDAASSCANARAGLGSTNNNQDFTMVAVDVDTVETGANSSSATLSVPAGATVRFAGLYWGAISSSAARNQARLRTPASSAYNSLTASQLDVSGTAYHAFADVTTLVAAGGSGAYTVADVKASTGTNAYAGWSLVVMYTVAGESPHNVTVFDGFASVTNGGGGATMTVSGFVTPPSGLVNTRMATAAYEGDLGNPGDGLKLNAVSITNAANAANNVFNSTISNLGVHVTAKTPNYVNQLGYDSDSFDVSGILANSATSATVQFTPGSDNYLPGVLVFSTEVYQPLLDPNFTKTVTDVNGGLVTPGDILEYTVSVANTGNDTANSVVLTDAIPANTTYVAGSLSVVSGANAGAKSDASGDDQAELAAGNVVFRLGTGATPAAGGSLAVSASTSIRFRVTIDAATGNGTTISNSARIAYVEQQLGGSVSIDSSAAAVTLHLPDLTINKSHSGNFVRGSTGTYSVVVTNSGLGATTGMVTVSDTLPAGLTPTTATGAGWACSVLGQDVSCTRSDVLAVGSGYPAISITTTVAQSAAASVTNTATVGGGGESEVSNDSDSDATTVVSRADLAITKSGPSSTLAGNNVFYTVTVTNNGASDATSVSIVDSTPSGLTFVSNTGACTTAYPCSLGTLAAGATATITSTFFVPGTYTAPSPILNSATATSATVDPVSANNSATASTTLTPSTDLSISKSGPVSATAGSNVVYTVIVSNLGGTSAASVSVADPTPAGLVFVSNSGDCTTAYPCSLGSVAASATRTITTTYSVPASYTTPNPIVNTATVSSTTVDPASANNSSMSSTPVTTSADLAITKTGPVSATAGANVVYTVTLINNGVSDAASVSVADPTPPGLAFVSNTGACTTTYPCALGTVAAGATRTITTTFSVSPSYAAPGPISNTATVSSATSDPSAANNSSTSSTPVTTSADLAITKTGPASAVAGANVVYTVVVTNNGLSDAAAVSVADPTPAGLTFVSNTGDCTSVYPCALAAVPAGATRTITTTYSVPPSYVAPDPIVNTVTVSSSTTDPVPGNNSSTSSTPLTTSADLAITKSGPASVVAGDDVVYTVTITNNGSSDAAAVSVADPTPSGLTFVSNTGDCTTAYPCALGTVADGATRTITSTYSVPPSYATPNPIVNTATVSSTTSDPAPADNTSAASTTVSSSADLSVGKTGPASVVAGNDAVFTVTVTNNGISDAAAVSVADVTPAGLVFVSNTGDCASSYPCALGNMAPGQTRTITTTYDVPSSYTAPSPFLNTATVSSPTTDPTPANNSSTSSTTVTTSADVSISKTGPVAVITGTDLVYTVVVTNNGDSDALAVSVADPTPTGLTFVSNSGDCTTSYPCSLGTVPAGSTRTITSTFAVPPAYTTPDPILNTATVSASTGDPVAANNTATSSTDLTIIDADLEVVKTGPASAVPGSNVVYTVEVTNNGPDDAPSTSVADPTPENLVFVSNTGDCVTSYPCALGTLTAGQTRTITTTYSVPASYTTPDPIFNTASATHGAGDSVPANNSSTSSTAVTPSADMAITKSDATDPVSVDSPEAYTIVVTNNGPGNASAIVVTDTLDPATTFVSGSAGCSASLGTVTCNLAALASGASTSLTINVLVDSGAPIVGTLQDGPCDGSEDICNTVGVSAAQSDPNPANNTATEPTDVEAPTIEGLSLAITDSPDPVPSGTTLTYVLTYSNDGTATISGVQLDVVYDARTIFVSASPSPTTGDDHWSLASLDPGEVGEILIEVAVDSGTVDGDTLLASAELDGSGAIPALVDEETHVREDLAGHAALTLAKSTSPDSVPSGGLFTYTLTVANDGPATAYGTIVSDALPVGLTYLNASPSPDVVAGNSIEWNAGDVAAGSTLTYTVYAQTDALLSAGTLIENVAFAEGTTGPGTIASAGLDAEGSDTASVSGPAADCGLVLRLRSLGIAMPGGEFVYRLLWNDPCDQAPATTITLDLDPELEFVTVSGADVQSSAVSVVSGHERVTLDVGTIGRGRVGAAFVRTRVTDAAAFGAILTSDLTLADAAGRTVAASDASTIRDPAAVAITKSNLRVTGPLRMIAGGSPRYVLRYRDVPPDTSLTVSVSGNFTGVSFSPAPTATLAPPPGTSGAWVFSGLEGRGTIRMSGQESFQGPREASGVISIDVVASAADDSGIVKSGRDVGVLPRSGAFSNSSLRRVSTLLKTRRFVTGSQHATARLRYRKIQGAPVVTMNLPSIMLPDSYSPGSVTSLTDNAFRWDNLPEESGWTQVESTVPDDLIPQESLAVAATVTDEFGTMTVERAKGAP